MTEFTIIGNLVRADTNTFTVEEGKELYEINPVRGSSIIKELKTFDLGTRIKVSGIMKGNTLYCQRVTIVLGVQ